MNKDLNEDVRLPNQIQEDDLIDPDSNLHRLRDFRNNQDLNEEENYRGGRDIVDNEYIDENKRVDHLDIDENLNLGGRDYVDEDIYDNADDFADSNFVVIRTVDSKGVEAEKHINNEEEFDDKDIDDDRDSKNDGQNDKKRNFEQKSNVENIDYIAEDNYNENENTRKNENLLRADNKNDRDNGKISDIKDSEDSNLTDRDDFKNVTKRNIKTNKDTKNKNARDDKTKHTNSKGTITDFFQADNLVLTLGILGSLGLIFSLCYLFGDYANYKDILLNEESYIFKYNKKNRDYSIKANNFFQNMSLEQIGEFFKPKLSTKKLQPYCKTVDLNGVIVPGSYNFYDQYPNCRFSEIQQRTSSGYAEILASVFRNRYCITHIGDDFTPSVDYLLNCDAARHGSHAEALNNVVDYVKKYGFISNKCWLSLKKDDSTCVSKNELKKCDKTEMFDFCYLNSIIYIKKEIFKNGPVLSLMDPYQNFLLYDRGIFNFDKSRKIEGMVFVKIVGWGKDEKNTEYWLVESIWGKSWGDNGLAKVKMNVKESMLDNLALVVHPKAPEIKTEVK